jgi:ubiquitin carboxyl-terminal hydrolase 34
MVGQPAGSKVSLEENNEAVSDKQPNTTPPSSSSSSPSASRDSGEPNVELIAIDDEFEAGQEQLPIAIIDNDDEDEDDDDVYDQRMPAFPFNRREEPLAITARKIARYLEYDPVEDEGTFCKLRDWIDVYLEISKHHESSWYDAYHSNREFWDMIPNIVWALSRRRNFFGSFMQKSREGRRALTEFLCQFARLAGRFVAMDLPTVVSTHESGEAIPELGSNAYLKAFGWLLRKEETGHIGRNLEAHYRWNWNDDITMMMSSFMAGGGSVTNLTRYVDGILALTAQKPTLIECLTEPSRIVDRAVSDAAQILSEPERSHKRHIESCEQVMTQGYLFFEVMSQGLPVIIEKHVTLLTPEAALTHFIGLSHILHCCLLYNCPPALDLLEDHQSKHPSLSQDWAPLVISSEWKFSILRKLIFSSQMQLRVIGVTQMCGDLLGLYKEFKRDDPAAQPILVHFANFVLDLKVLDYIVGKGAHTEIINESHNIAGFLVATKTYPTELTDTIWQTVTTSQDSRVVEAILKMLVQILNLHDYEALLYLCGRASQLPLESFTAAMREYCESLLKSLVLKASAEKIPAIDAPPYQLCVRLIRESSILSATLPNGHLDLQRFAVTRLRELIPHGPESTVRNSIYVSCIEDISKRTATSAGSICALLQVLKANFATDLHILTTEHGLTALMIEELEVTNSGEQAAFLNPASNARRELLLQIINHEPSTITPELGVRLWTALVGPGARNTEVRNGGWQILNSAAKRNPCNKFVVTCFKEYLPTLNPEFFTLGSLDFARASIFASISNSANSVVDQEHASDISCVEQLWRMVLNAPPCSIEAPAINVLVELYIDSPMISNMPRTRAHNVHLALVNRCLDQLSTAATKLTAFSDGSLSGEEDAMVVVVSSEQVQEQEMMFTRSLNILREFLRAYQSKPHYMLAPPRSPVVKLVNEPVGELFTIKYQVFDGESISGVKELTIGKQNTVASLFAKVQKVTGFKGCKIYHWGKEIDLDETDVLAVLEDLKIGHGLLLVKRSSDEDSIEGHLKSRASTIELEIMKHIDNLWKYLGMEEKLAREVCSHLHCPLITLTLK